MDLPFNIFLPQFMVNLSTAPCWKSNRLFPLYSTFNRKLEKIWLKGSSFFTRYVHVACGTVMWLCEIENDLKFSFSYGFFSLSVNTPANRTNRIQFLNWKFQWGLWTIEKFNQLDILASGNILKPLATKSTLFPPYGSIENNRATSICYH